MSLNKAVLIGNVGKTPEIRTTQDGRKIANFSLATSESWKDKNTGERKSKTEWHNIVIFNPGIIGIVETYVKKGSKLYIEGSLHTRKWQDKKGIDHYTTEVVLQAFNCTLQLLDSKDKSDDQDQYKPDYNQDKEGASITSTNNDFAIDDEVPF